MIMKSDKITCRVASGDAGILLTSLIEEGVKCSIRVHGTSMTPCIGDGDMVEISPMSGDVVGIGDIVAAVPADGAALRVHRVVGRRIQNGVVELLLKGDRCREDDGWILPERIIGTVVIAAQARGSAGFGTSGFGKYPLALLSRLGLLARIACWAGAIMLAACPLLAQEKEDLDEPAVAGTREKQKSAKPIVVLKQAAINGQVFFISDKEGEQRSAQRVKIQIEDIDTGGQLFKTVTDKDGKYVLPNFDKGRYRFIVGRLKLDLEIREPQEPGKRGNRLSKNIIVFIPEAMR